MLKENYSNKMHLIIRQSERAKEIFGFPVFNHLG